MLRDIKLIEVKSVGTTTIATIGAITPEQDDKMFYNAVRYNDELLDLNQEETDIINDELDESLQNIADKNFN